MKLPLLLLSIFVCIILPTSKMGEGSTKTFRPDQSIEEALLQLNCSYKLEELKDIQPADYNIIKQSALTLKDTWMYDDYTIELFTGSKEDYLVIARIDYSVYCAQYVNNVSFRQVENQEDKIEQFYYHEAVSAGYGIYYKERIAFFSDGTALVLVYYDPMATEPMNTYIDTRINLIETNTAYTIFGTPVIVF